MEVDSEEVVGYQGDIWDSSDDDLYVAYDTSEMVVDRQTKWSVLRTVTVLILMRTVARG